MDQRVENRSPDERRHGGSARGSPLATASSPIASASASTRRRSQGAAGRTAPPSSLLLRWGSERPDLASALTRSRSRRRDDRELAFCEGQTASATITLIGPASGSFPTGRQSVSASQEFISSSL